MKEIHSDISGFYKLTIEERQRLLMEMYDFTPDELKILTNYGYFTENQIDNLIENVIGSFQLPIGLACNFIINKKDYLIPMVIEEPSVIAAASNAARIARRQGGFFSDPVRSVMIGQIQITKVKNDIETIDRIIENKEEILKIANEQDPKINELGGGAYDLEIRDLITSTEKIIIIHLLVDVVDAMGANVVNTMAEAIAPHIEDLCGGKVYLRIVSNLAMHRIAKSYATFDKELLGGDEVVDGIMKAYEFALADPYRAATHNKGIMNGISAVALATGNDTRAIEAGAHAYASLIGIYSPLTKYELDKKRHLYGEISVPLPLGILGGMTNLHPMAKIALKILQVQSAEELSQVTAAVGLAQNVAALRALSSEGIQKGHMKLQARRLKK